MLIQCVRVISFLAMIGLFVMPATVAAANDVPVNTQIQVQLASPNDIPPAQTVEHEVEAGETLSSVAEMYGVTVAALAEINELTDTDLIFAGQVLIIPDLQDAAASVSNCAEYHVVEDGDSLASIAWRYDTTVIALIVANELEDDVIDVGMTLCIPVNTAVSGTPVSEPDTNTPSSQPSYETYERSAPTPPEYKPYPEVAGETPQMSPAPGYQAPSTSYTGGEPGETWEYVPPTNEPFIVRTLYTWIGNQTADPEDPDGITTLIVMTNEEDLNVVIRGENGFAARGVTGVFFEYSWVPTFAFRGIPPGTYEVWIEGAPSKVAIANVHVGHRPLVEFKQEAIVPDLYDGIIVGETGSGPGWVVEVVENTNGPEPVGAASILVVRTGANDNNIIVSAPGGFETTCRTGTKPENGPGACNIGGLNAGTYTVVLEGAGVGVEIFLDGVGTATVEFRPAR